jgi:sulfoxide reductase heme-binding subunit YedZ
MWYLTRGSGVVAIVFLTASVLLGILTSFRWHSEKNPRFVVEFVHRNVSLLVLVFLAVHVVTVVADGFVPIRWLDVVVPFVSAYRPVWLGLGTVALDLLLALVITSLLRPRIGARAWRAVHWLAYVSWPIALLHTLGTGSDARTTWLQLLSVGCLAVVLGAVAWRLVAARAAEPALRLGAALLGVGVPLAILAWAQTGPLRPGWAAKAGTPTQLLASAHTVTAAAVTVARTPVSTRQPDLPRTAFTATLTGTITNRQQANGLVVVTIDAAARGGFRGRVHVALRGEALDNGGVQMLQNVVGVLPTGADAWQRGTVTGLSGQRIDVAVQTPSGTTRQLTLDLQLDASLGTVGGTLTAGAASGDEG